MSTLTTQAIEVMAEQIIAPALRTKGEVDDDDHVDQLALVAYLDFVKTIVNAEVKKEEVTRH